MLFVRCFIFLLLEIFICSCQVVINRQGGYENIVVGISPEIPEEKLEFLIHNLEILFKNASNILYKATRREAYFSEITFLYPKSINISLFLSESEMNQKFFKDPNVYLIPEGLAENPYTLHNQGCGKQGLRIDIPTSFLMELTDEKARSLVREWAHYRFGVFDESGFLGDEIYPPCYYVPGTDVLMVSDCTNVNATYLFRQSNGLADKPNISNCKPVPDFGQNENVIASLMNKLPLPKVDYFCDSGTYYHNRNAPTKQNALCRETSTWDVIRKHKDFRHKRIGNPKNRIPTFKYVMKDEPRIILAVDNSFKMKERLDLVRNAFAYFVLYGLPRDTQAGVMKLKQVDDFSKPLFLSLHTQNDAERLIDAFPELESGEEESCVECGIQEALKVLELDDDRHSGTIVIATATDIPETWLLNITSSILSSGVRLHVIFFGTRVNESPLLEHLTSATGGRFFYIFDDLPYDNPVSSLTLLYEAFRSIYGTLTWTNNDQILVVQKTFADNATKYALNFTCDRSMDNFQVVLTGPDFKMGPPVIKDRIILASNDQVYTQLHESFSIKNKIPAYIFTISDPEPGVWTFTFERKPGFLQPLVVNVRSMATHYDSALSIHAKFIHHDRTGMLANRRPFRFFAEIKKANFPVMDATVRAYIYRPDIKQDIVLDLTDNGDGDPDITKHDGIYSRYLTEALTPGHYILTVVAEAEGSSVQNISNNKTTETKPLDCCGSSIPEHLSYNAGAFQRSITYGSFYVESRSQITNYPPRRIQDLHVTRVYSPKYTRYVLKWTAPGDELDKGTAAAYELQVFKSREDALDSFNSSQIMTITEWNVEGPWLIPQPAGTVQTCIIHLKNLLESGIYYLSMRAVSRSNLVGDVSNVVQIAYTSPIRPTDSLTSILPNETSESGDDQDKSTSVNPEVGVAIGISTGLLFFLLIIGVILIVYLSRCHRRKKKEQGGLDVDPVKTDSNDTLCQSTTTSISFISPVNSWPADSLVSHYETLQRRKAGESHVDGVSISSSKENNSCIYDPLYFQTNLPQDYLNYPYNPEYQKFDPKYTSSLSRLRRNDLYESYLTPDVVNYNASTLDSRRSYRLKTDV